jgi:flap endonuclease-1
VTDDYEIDGECDPDIEAAREFVVEEWGVAAEEVETGFDRIDAATEQTGLGRFT